VIRTSPIEAERELAVPDADARTLDLLLRLADHPDPGVRAAVVRSLAASDDARGVAAVARGLEDEASGVRWTAAIEIECLADPAHLPALLDRVARETHPLAADSMVRAISALDPEGGVRRVEEAVARAPATVRAVVLAAVAAPVIDVAEDVPVAPAQAAGPDEGTRAYLDRLVAEYRSLPAGQERLAVLEKLAKAHADYLHRSGDASLLAFLAGIARTSPVEDERVAAVRSFSRTDDRRVVDLLMELKQDADAPVRCAVAAALAWTQGQEADRARQALLELLGDPAASVRRTVAMFVHTPLGDPGNVPRLLSGLRSETDLLAAYAMIDAVLRLDPEAGAARVDAARSEASPSTQAVIDSALRLRAGR
jgi:HEAT repeat protein